MSRSRPADTRHFRVLVFDWDGTLMNSIASIVECTEATLDELNLPPAGGEVIRAAIGLGLREIVERFAPDCDDATYRLIVDTYRRLWFDRYSRQPRLFCDVADTLEELRERGFLLAVATAKSRRGLDRDLRATALEGVFQATRTADESRNKPHPQMILDILEVLDVQPHQALMIGDTAHDVEMAHSAGAQAVAVGTGSHGRDDLLKASPLAYFERLGELPLWLAGGAKGLASG